MGYRVGSVCFATREGATDYKVSMMTPTVLPDGRVISPVKNAGNWQINNEIILLDFPECDPVAEFRAGVEIAAVFVGAIVLAWCFRFTARFIERMADGDRHYED